MTSSASPTPSTAPSGKPASFVGWLVVERALRAAVSAIALSVVARHLAPNGFGALNLALTLVGIAMPMAQFGLDLVLVRELVRSPSRAGHLLGTATVLRVTWGVASAALVFGLGQIVPAFSAARDAIGPVSLMLFVQALETPDLWFRARVQSWPTALARTIAVVAGAAGKILLAMQGAGLVAFAWLTLGELCLFEAMLWLLYRRSDAPRVKWRWDTATARSLTGESAMFAIAATLGGIAFRVDQLAVAWLLGDSAAGQYFAALRLIEIPTFVAASLSAALLPALARNEHAVADGQFERSVGLMAGIAWLTAIATTLLGPLVLRVFFGQDYAAASGALILRAWALLPFFSVLIRTNVITATRSAPLQLVGVLVNFVAQLGFGLLLIPSLGLTGAALAFLCAELAGAWLFPLFHPALRPMIRAQTIAWLLPWRPAAWPQLLGLLRSGESTTESRGITQSASSP